MAPAQSSTSTKTSTTTTTKTSTSSQPAPTKPAAQPEQPTMPSGLTETLTNAYMKWSGNRLFLGGYYDMGGKKVPFLLQKVKGIAAGTTTADIIIQELNGMIREENVTVNCVVRKGTYKIIAVNVRSMATSYTNFTDIYQTSISKLVTNGANQVWAIGWNAGKKQNIVYCLGYGYTVSYEERITN